MPLNKWRVTLYLDWEMLLTPFLLMSRRYGSGSWSSSSSSSSSSSPPSSSSSSPSLPLSTIITLSSFSPLKKFVIMPYYLTKLRTQLCHESKLNLLKPNHAQLSFALVVGDYINVNFLFKSIFFSNCKLTSNPIFFYRQLLLTSMFMCIHAVSKFV